MDAIRMSGLDFVVVPLASLVSIPQETSPRTVKFLVNISSTILFSRGCIGNIHCHIKEA